MVSREDRRIRAKLLSKKFPESAQLLELYIQLTLLQDDIARNPDPDAKKLAAYFPRLRALVPDLPSNEDSERFLWHVVTQPYAERFRKPGEGVGSTCPSCGSKPVAGVLRGEGDGAKRALICSLCGLEWPYRR